RKSLATKRHKKHIRKMSSSGCRIRVWAWMFIIFAVVSFDVSAQRRTKKKPAAPAPPPPTELSKLREDFINATKDYKASLAKLLPYYESDVKKAEDKVEQSKKLLAEGLIPKSQLEENERVLTAAKQKLAETNRAITG